MHKILIMLNRAKNQNFTNSQNKDYFRKVKILLPITWDYPTDAVVQGESFISADFR